MSTTREGIYHWADAAAERILRERGEKPCYTCASGTTPSGTVHIGNFRDIITVEMVVRALRERGKKTRFIFSWDDYDVFRKVPENVPKRDLLVQYLRQPIVVVPDPWGKEDSYAMAHERRAERTLPEVGIFPEYLYQAERYRSSCYAEGIKKALEKRERLRAQLNKVRTTPLPDSWWPVSIFCTRCYRDRTQVLHWDGAYEISFSCSECLREETMDLRHTGAVKLPWRIDWPMRWYEEEVDFEPAGKDHHTDGGSFDTAKRTVQEVYHASPPTTLQYDFVKVKGGGGKLSSSGGEVLSLEDVLKVYQPEVVRYLFSRARPNTEFAISFDMDALKVYEDYDRCEREYFASSHKGDKGRAKRARIYELSQVGHVPKIPPYQISFRQLSSLVQLSGGHIEETVSRLEGVSEKQKPRLRKRAACALYWVRHFAPEEMVFSLRDDASPPFDLTEEEKQVVSALGDALEGAAMDAHEEKTLTTHLYDIAREREMPPPLFFALVYRLLIGKERGPRLATFLLSLGKKRVLEILAPYRRGVPS